MRASRRLLHCAKQASALRAQSFSHLSFLRCASSSNPRFQQQHLLRSFCTSSSSNNNDNERKAAVTNISSRVCCGCHRTVSAENWLPNDRLCLECDEQRQTDRWKKVAVAGKVVAVGGLVVATGGVGLALAGFSTAGIVGGSIAAASQASIGNIAAGSLFAMLQSAGATGAIASATSAGIGTAVVGGTTAAVSSTMAKSSGPRNQ
mmetsp:Transcript_17087/g.27277  ORF Transcript_17087/g.27277 Transcript_17087/m.27277 type:complete len:205 (-) Transcript_17087:6-620(-)